MNRFILIFTLFISCNLIGSYAQKTKSKAQSNISVLNKRIDQKADSVFTVLNQRIEMELKQIDELKAYNKELKEELIMYKAKEDYFAAALSEQTGIFSLIVIGLLTLAGFGSLSWLRSEKRNIIAQFDKFKSDFKRIEKKHEKTLLKLHITAGNSNTSIANNYRANKTYILAMRFSILSTVQHCKVQELREEKNYKTAIVNLKNAVSDVKIIRSDDGLKRGLRLGKAFLIEKIDEIALTDNSEIKSLCAELRVLTETA